MKRSNNYWLHVIIWMTLISALFAAFGQKVRVLKSPSGFEYSITYDYAILMILLIDFAFKSIMFYVNQYILIAKKTVFMRRKLWVAISFLSTLVLSLSVWWLAQFILSDQLDSAGFTFKYMVWYVLFFHLLIFLASFGYSIFLQKRHDEQVKQSLKEEKLETELKFLKSQISPHFLFNTLNNIYAMVSKYNDPKVAKSIAQLSRLLRYMIYESSAKTVPLNRELEYLKDYLSLQRIRLPNPDFIDYSEKITIGSQPNIAPMLFITFVENAFKHGQIDEYNPMKIRFYIDSSLLIFEIRNKSSKHNTNSQYQGLGLDNVRKRLENIYRNRYVLDIEEDEFFNVKLSINL